MSNERPGNAVSRSIGWIISPKLTVICLLLLMGLTFWGTVYQVENGLYAAQQRFYNSWVFFAGGFIPMPGTQLVLAVLLVNLLGYLIKMVLQHKLKFGILVIHLGILTLLLGGALTHNFAEESQLTLQEGEASNVSAAYHDWELAVWRHDGDARDVMAVDADGLRPGDTIRFGDSGLTVEVDQYYVNARAFQSGAGEGGQALSAAGITSLQPARLSKDPAQNIAGGIFKVTVNGQPPVRLLLYGEDTSAHGFDVGDDHYHVALRHRRYPLPFLVSLIDFNREMHPGTDVAKSFSSKVDVEENGADRKLTISMNKPLRARGYTLYQASYREAEDGTQWSTFAVARNYGRLIPYISTAVVVFGMVWHFLVMLAKRVRGAAA